jgi:hypothetical protein
LDFSQALGLNVSEQDPVLLHQNLHLYINLKLASCGQPTCLHGESVDFMATADDMLRSFVEKNRQLVAHQYPADQRIQDFLSSYLAELNLESIPTLPTITFELDRHGIARELSLPMGQDEFHSECVSSYKVNKVFYITLPMTEEQQKVLFILLPMDCLFQAIKKRYPGKHLPQCYNMP